MTRLVPYRVAFFDIGNTLGHVREQGSTLQLCPFASTGSLLQIFGEALGLRLGIITNSGRFELQHIRGMLDRGDPREVVSRSQQSKCEVLETGTDRQGAL
jgi:hypothetical protein